MTHRTLVVEDDPQVRGNALRFSQYLGLRIYGHGRRF